MYIYFHLGLNTPDRKGPIEFILWLCQVVFWASHKGVFCKTALSSVCRSHGTFTRRNLTHCGINLSNRLCNGG